MPTIPPPSELNSPPPTTRTLVGRTFGRLTVYGFGGRRRRNRRWVCRCQCGRWSVHTESNLLSGRSQSCGVCHRGGLLHGLSGTRLYASWVYYKTKRCLAPEWSRSPAEMLAVVGPPQPGFRLVRPDTSKPLGPGNWAWQPCGNDRTSRSKAYVGKIMAELGSNDPELRERLARVSRQRAYMIRRKLLGLCTRCGGPKPCPAHPIIPRKPQPRQILDDPFKLAAFKRLYQRKLRDGDLAAALQCSKQTIARTRHALGLPSHGRPGRSRKLPIAKIAAERRRHSVAEIARKYGVTQQTVYAYLHAAGVWRWKSRRLRPPSEQQTQTTPISPAQSEHGQCKSTIPTSPT